MWSHCPPVASPPNSTHRPQVGLGTMVQCPHTRSWPLVRLGCPLLPLRMWLCSSPAPLTGSPSCPSPRWTLVEQQGSASSGGSQPLVHAPESLESWFKPRSPTPNDREAALLTSPQVLLLVLLVVQCPETTRAEPLARFSPPVLGPPAFTHPLGTEDKKCPRPSPYPTE